jgi:hypothetical protein
MVRQFITAKVICCWKLLDNISLEKCEGYYRRELNWDVKIKFSDETKKYYGVVEINAFYAN